MNGNGRSCNSRTLTKRKLRFLFPGYINGRYKALDGRVQVGLRSAGSPASEVARGAVSVCRAAAGRLTPQCVCRRAWARKALRVRQPAAENGDVGLAVAAQRGNAASSRELAEFGLNGPGNRAIID